MILKIESKRIEPDITLLALSGRFIGGNESMRLEWKLDELIKENERKVILDLSGITYIDSGGVGIIALSGGRMKRAGGEMRLAGAQGTVKEVLTFTRIGDFLGSFPSVEEAAASFAAS
jgi:anti-anti-sigma factor